MEVHCVSCEVGTEFLYTILVKFKFHRLNKLFNTAAVIFIQR
jgi:hypothetical protein